MKKILLSVFILLCLAVPVLSVVSTDGIIDFWTFEDTRNGSINNSIMFEQNAFHRTDGYIGKDYRFNDDNTGLFNNTDYFPFTAGSNFSMAMFVNNSEPTGYGVPFWWMNCKSGTMRALNIYFNIAPGNIFFSYSDSEDTDKGIPIS